MRLGLVSAGALAGFIGTAASARAAAPCSVEALNAVQVSNVSVTDATPVAAGGTIPAYRDVQGTVVTKGEGVADGLARFAIQLLEAWQQRFLFLGVGGNAGNLDPRSLGERRRPNLGAGQGPHDDPDRHRSYRQRLHRQVDAPAGRQSRHGEEDRLFLSRPYPDHRTRFGHAIVPPPMALPPAAGSRDRPAGSFSSVGAEYQPRGPHRDLRSSSVRVSCSPLI